MQFRTLLRIVTVGMSPDHREMVVEAATTTVDRSRPGWRRRLRQAIHLGQTASFERLGDTAALDGIVVTGLALIVAGSLAFAGARGAAVGSFLFTAVVATVLGALLRARTYRPLLGAVLAVLIAVAMASQLLTSDTEVLADVAVAVAMSVACLFVVVAFVGLVGVGPTSAAGLPEVIRGRPWSLRGWRHLSTALVAIALSDLAGALTAPAPGLVTAGLLANAAGAALIAMGIRRSLAPVVRPA